MLFSGCRNEILQAGGLNHIHFSRSSGGWEVRAQGAGRLTSRLADGHLLTVSSRGERANSSVFFFAYKDTNLIVGKALSWPRLNLIASQRPHLHIPSPCGVRGGRSSLWIWWGNKYHIHDNMNFIFPLLYPTVFICREHSLNMQNMTYTILIFVISEIGESISP